MKDMKLPTAILSIKSIIRDDVPQIKGRVRGQLTRLVYKLEKLKSNQTRVTVEIMVNPKGLLPHFMINLIQKDSGNWVDAKSFINGLKNSGETVLGDKT